MRCLMTGSTCGLISLRSFSYSSSFSAMLPNSLSSISRQMQQRSLAQGTHLRARSRLPSTYTHCNLKSSQCLHFGRSPLHFVFLCLHDSQACATRFGSAPTDTTMDWPSLSRRRRRMAILDVPGWEGGYNGGGGRMLQGVVGAVIGRAAS